jgi:hypothetical protein
MIDSSPLGNSRAEYLRIALASGHVPLAQSAVHGISENHNPAIGMMDQTRRWLPIL